MSVTEGRAFRLEIPDVLKNRILNSAIASQAVYRAVSAAALKARKLLADRTPYDTGNTAMRWQVQLAGSGSPEAIVFNDSHVMLYLEYGTGIYTTFPGSQQKRIKPRTAKAFPFKLPDGRTIFRSSIKGIPPLIRQGDRTVKATPPNFIVRGALEQIEKLLQEEIEKAIGEYLS